MEIYVLNKSFDIIEVIDSYTSIIWTMRYFTDGDFELYLPASTHLIETLQRDFYLCRDKDIVQTEAELRYKHVMIIEDINVTTDAEDKSFMVVTGRCLKSIIGRRIVWQQTNLTGKAEQGIRRLIIENAISPTIATRKISNLKLAAPLGLSDIVDTQYTGDNLKESVEQICQSFGYGYDIDIVNGDFELYLYVGADRSYNQTENPYVIFSPEFENLLTTEYKCEMQGYKNVALVAGEGEGLQRKTAATYMGTKEPSGLTRRELFVDARDVSTNNGEVTEAEYEKLLIAKGTDNLTQNMIQESFEGATETTLSYTLNEDYFLGDIVQVINEYGISATPRILEVIESEDENGINIIPTFSTLEI